LQHEVHRPRTQVALTAGSEPAGRVEFREVSRVKAPFGELEGKMQAMSRIDDR
jgi:hypothetical protein